MVSWLSRSRRLSRSSSSALSARESLSRSSTSAKRFVFCCTSRSSSASLARASSASHCSWDSRFCSSAFSWPRDSTAEAASSRGTCHPAATAVTSSCSPGGGHSRGTAPAAAAAAPAARPRRPSSPAAGARSRLPAGPAASPHPCRPANRSGWEPAMPHPAEMPPSLRHPGELQPTVPEGSRCALPAPTLPYWGSPTEPTEPPPCYPGGAPEGLLLPHHGKGAREPWTRHPHDRKSLGKCLSLCSQGPNCDPGKVLLLCPPHVSPSSSEPPDASIPQGEGGSAPGLGSSPAPSAAG